MLLHILLILDLLQSLVHIHDDQLYLVSEEVLRGLLKNLNLGLALFFDQSLLFGLQRHSEHVKVLLDVLIEGEALIFGLLVPVVHELRRCDHRNDLLEPLVHLIACLLEAKLTKLFLD